MSQAGDTPRAMSQGNVEIIRHAFEAFNDGDFSVFLNLYDEDIVLRISPPSIESGSYYGAVAVQHQYQLPPKAERPSSP